MTNNLEDRLTQVLASKSADAPPADGLVQAAQARHLRRRRAQRGGAALALMAVLVPAGVVGHGLIRHDPSEPEPLGPYRYGQHQRIADAVPAGEAPGFRTLDYGVPSHSPAGIPTGNRHETFAPFQEYLDIDAQGRLLAMRLSPHQHGGTYLDTTYQVVPGPGRPARQVPAPDKIGHTDHWTPSFTADGRILWAPGSYVEQSAWIDHRISDLAGRNLQELVPPRAEALPSSRVFPSQRGVWIDGGRAWFSAVTKTEGPAREHVWVSLFSFDPAHPDQVRREAATDVSEIDVANGRAVWIDGSTTKVFVEDLTTQQVREVPLPLGSGCRLPDDLDGGEVPKRIVTNGSVIALTEYCPDSRTTRELVVDLSGRLVTEVDPGEGNQVYWTALSDQTVPSSSSKGGGTAPVTVTRRTWTTSAPAIWSTSGTRCRTSTPTSRSPAATCSGTPAAPATSESWRRSEGGGDLEGGSDPPCSESPRRHSPVRSTSALRRAS